MREIRTSGSEGGAGLTPRSYLYLTLNRFDFIRLHQETQGAHAGIIVCTRDDADPPALASRIYSALAATGNPAGHLLRVVRTSR